MVGDVTFLSITCAKSAFFAGDLINSSSCNGESGEPPDWSVFNYGKAYSHYS